MLYLHNNPIMDPYQVLHLSDAPTLNVLTMYDTPISLERFYRHRAVNAIRTLLILDRHVIADEEA